MSPQSLRACVENLMMASFEQACTVLRMLGLVEPSGRLDMHLPQL